MQVAVHVCDDGGGWSDVCMSAGSSWGVRADAAAGEYTREAHSRGVRPLPHAGHRLSQQNKGIETIEAVGEKTIETMETLYHVCHFKDHTISSTGDRIKKEWIRVEGMWTLWKFCISLYRLSAESVCYWMRLKGNTLNVNCWHNKTNFFLLGHNRWISWEQQGVMQNYVKLKIWITRLVYYTGFILYMNNFQNWYLTKMHILWKMVAGCK